MSQRYVLQVVDNGRGQREQWDDFVGGHGGGHLLQSWGWGELKSRAGWQPRRFVLWDQEQQCVVGAAQVLSRTLPHVPLRAGYLAYIPKGPVVDWAQPEMCAALLTQLRDRLRREGALALLMEPGRIARVAEDDCMWEGFAPLPVRPTRAIQPLRTVLLDLTPSEETLLARMKEKWRYNVRLASRKGVTVRVATTEDDVRAWYELLQTTGERDAFGIHTPDYYLSAWRIFASRNQGRMLLAEYNGQLLAGIFVGLFAQEGLYLYGASGNEYRNLMPNYLLQWEAIRWAKEQGASRYDFWGIPETDDENESMAGVYRFKSGWGGEIVRFVGCYEHVLRPRIMGLARRLLPANIG
jgi:peptidoglycan pentaglycine glycine transferase (the first glycine)